MKENLFDLPKTYDFQSTEGRIYDKWNHRGYFEPTNDPNKPGHDPNIEPFVISIPPPNVTGELHLGHALFVSMEDLMIRYHRMRGKPTLWVPGTDHAGIATQLQVEKTLRKEGSSREEIGRENFLKKAWAWKEKYGGIITQQIRRLGASCDWHRERFTLDEGLSKAVREAFVQLYEKGLIYRGPRLINWSPGLKTAVSDLEVEHYEEKGYMYYFKYMLVGSDEFLPVATTRPETILGDTAVAVHPEDQRFQKFVGKMVIVPILGREIPIIEDAYVDQSFGTGALKVTPGHDPTDYDIGIRHNLPIISVLDKEARVNENGGPYEGLDRFEAREKLWADMRIKGLVLKQEPHNLIVPRSQRGGEIIEPMVSTQWFVDIQPLANKALSAVRDGRIKIVPERFTKVYYNWLENIQDWCISRQLWWGHRIPVWYCVSCGEMTVKRQDPTKCAYCGDPNIYQDPDVLDTWFSSGLWPFSTLGWPDHTPDFEYFYPTSVLETGYDILFFWVARMIMMGLEFTGNIPFHTVYLHGIIRDENGQKMSKTAGNVIDPLVVMDKLGADALRFTLLVGSSPGNDTNVSVKRVEANRNFANKVWNAGRFVLNALPDTPEKPQRNPDPTLADRWISTRLADLVRTTDRLFDNYQFGEAGRQIYEFFWGDFADWYVEIAKLQLSQGGDRAFYTAQNLIRIMDNSLRLLHPFTPFVTEELWDHLKRAAKSHSKKLAPVDGWPDMLIVASYPEPWQEESWEKGSKLEFSIIQDIVRAVRNIRSEKQIDPGRRIPAILVSSQHKSALTDQAESIASLARLDASQLSIRESIPEKPEGHITLVAGPVEIFLPLASMVDLDEERQRLTKERSEAESQVQRLEKLLNSPFSEKAPPEIVEKERQKLVFYRETAEKLSEQLNELR